MNFVEVRECYLDHFIRLKNCDATAQPYYKPFKAVAGSGEEICLFPAELPTDACRSIARAFHAIPDDTVGVNLMIKVSYLR